MNEEEEGEEQVCHGAANLLKSATVPFATAGA